MFGYLKHKINKLVKMALFRMGIDTPGAYLTIAETIPGWVTWQELAEKSVAASSCRGMRKSWKSGHSWEGQRSCWLAQEN